MINLDKERSGGTRLSWDERFLEKPRSRSPIRAHRVVLRCCLTQMGTQSSAIWGEPHLVARARFWEWPTLPHRPQRPLFGGGLPRGPLCTLWRRRSDEANVAHMEFSSGTCAS